MSISTDESKQGWVTKRLDEVADILDNRRVPVSSKERAARHGSVPYFGATGQVGWIDDYLFDEEIVLLGEDGAPFLDSTKHKAYVVRGKSWVNNHAHVLRAKDGIPSLYLKYWLDRLDYRPFVNGTTRLKLTQAEMRRIPIPLAPERERYEIVSEIEKQFSRLDEAVANLQRVKANLKRYKASVLKDAVEGRLVPTDAELARREGRSFETGEQLLQRILEMRRGQWQKKTGYKEPSKPALSDQGELPVGWAWATVEQMNPGNRPCAYGVLQPGEDLTNGVPFVRVGDINDGLIDFSEMKRIHPDIASAYPRTQLTGGEVLLTLVGAIGRTAVAPKTLAGANVARAVGVLPINESVDSHWVEMWFRNPAKIAEMTGKSHEVARKTLNLEDVRLAAVALPPRNEQARIVAEVDHHLSIIREVEVEVDANLKRAQALRQSTLQKMFGVSCIRGN